MSTTTSTQQLAHQFWVELKTRITAEDLHYRSGDETTAAKSVASLFTTARELLRKADPQEAAELSILIDLMLNRVIRPYTARWHRWITTGLIENPAICRQFRDELNHLKGHLLPFIDALQTYALEKKWPPTFKPVPEPSKLPKTSKNAFLKHYKSAKARVSNSSEEEIQSGFINPNNEDWHSILETEENKSIAERRSPKTDPQKTTNLTGISLSGGGLRSASFCLGALAPLATAGLIKDTDYLSTVSGGGYTGAFLTENLNREELAEEDDPAQKLYCPDSTREHPFLRHVRNHSDYLFSGGLLTKFRIFALLAAGVVTNLLTIIPIIILTTILFFSFDQWMASKCGEMFTFSGFTWQQSFATFFAISSFLSWFGYALLLRLNADNPKATNDTDKRRSSTSRSSSLKGITYVFFFGLILCAILALMAPLHQLINDFFNKESNLRDQLESWPGSTTILTTSGLLPILFAAILKFINPKNLLRKGILILLSLSAPLFYLAIHFVVFFILREQLAENNLAPWIIGLVSGSFLLIGWAFLVDLNSTSPHHFYKDRLSLGFLLGQQDKQKTKDRSHALLSQINLKHAAPYHLINCALNLHNSDNKELRNRNSDFFLFSKHFCGSPSTGYVKTSILEDEEAHIDLASAAAISGAAVSSNMGMKTPTAFRFILSLLNIRLGYWIPNVFPSQGKPWGKISPPHQYHLFYEMFGIMMTEKNKRLNISDGGHIENLGTYELLRRRCKFIVAIDGGCDPEGNFLDFANLQRLANIDFGIDIEIDLSDLALDQNGNTRFHSTLGRIIYPKADGTGTETGWLLYLKLNTTGEEPDHILDYQRRNPAFPHESTGDQYYTEEQFHAYYALGRFATQQLLAKDLVGSNTPSTHADWFRKLSKKILNENLTSC